VSIDIKTSKHTTRKVDFLSIKTPKNNIVVKIGDDYYMFDSKLEHKTFLLHTKKSLHFYSSGDYFYALSDENKRDIIKFNDKNGAMFASYITNAKAIDTFAGIATLKHPYLPDTFNILFSTKKSLKELDLENSTKLKPFLQIKKVITDLYTTPRYIIATNKEEILIYSKKFKLLKKILLGAYNHILSKDSTTLYTENFALDLKNLEKQKSSTIYRLKETKLLLKKTKNGEALYSKEKKKLHKLFDDDNAKIFDDGKFLYLQRYGVLYRYDGKLTPYDYLADVVAVNDYGEASFSETDNHLYFNRQKSIKAPTRLRKLFVTKDRIVALDFKKQLFVYDKSLYLLQKIILDSRVNALSVTKNDILYYTIYDTIFAKKIGVK